MVRVRVRSPSFSRNWQRASSRVIEANKEGMRSAVRFIKPKILRVTPEDRGPLRRSFKYRIQNTATGIELKLYFTADYAAFVHEMPPTYNFTTPGTGPKFLQRPVIENKEQLFRIVAMSIRRALRG